MLRATATVIGNVALTRSAKAQTEGGDPDVVLLDRGQVHAYVHVKVFKGDKVEYNAYPEPVMKYLLEAKRLVEADEPEDNAMGEVFKEPAVIGEVLEDESQTAVATGLSDTDTTPITPETIAGAGSVESTPSEFG